MPAKQDILKKRKQIDQIDSKILKLINERTKISLDIRKQKQLLNQPRFSPRREEEIIQNLFKQNDGPLYNEDIRDIYTKIMKISRELPDE